MESKRDERPLTDISSWQAMSGPWSAWTPMSAWSSWMGMLTQWQRAWMDVWFTWPGLNGMQPKVPDAWKFSASMTRPAARAPSIDGEQIPVATQASATVRMPRLGCVGPADLAGLESVIAPREAVPVPAKTVSEQSPAKVARKPAAKAALKTAQEVAQVVAKKATAKPKASSAAKSKAPSADKPIAKSTQPKKS